MEDREEVRILQDKGTSIYHKNFLEGALVCIHRGEKTSF